MNKKLIIGLVVCFSILLPLFIFVVMRSSGPTPPPTATMTPSPSARKSPATAQTNNADQHPIASLSPRQSTTSEVFTILGTPTKTVQKDGYTILYYQLKDTDRTHKVFIKNGLVDYTIESFVADNKLYASYLAKKKKPNGVIYNLYENNAGFDLFVFSQDGTAFLAHGPSGYTAEVHHFAPVGYQTYFAKQAPQLTFK